MDFKMCDISDCQELAMCSCECRETPVFFCLPHIQDHFVSNFSLNHSVTNLYAHISDSGVSSLLEAKSEFLKVIDHKIKDLSDSHRDKLTKLNKKFLTQLEKLKCIKDKMIKIIEDGISSERIAKDQRGNILDSMMNRKSLENYQEKSFYDEIIKQLRLLDTDSFKACNQQFLYYFERKTKIMVRLNNETHKIKRIAINFLPENFGSRSGNCILDDGTVFYCGGKSSSVMKSCYIINPANKEWLKLADMPENNYQITALLHEGHIYVVGGYNNNSDLDSIYRYSLKQDKWDLLSTMPVSSNSCYSIQCNNHILFAGFQTKGVYAYSLSKNTFTKVLNGSSDGYCLLLKTPEDKVFALYNQKIYKSSVQNFKEWKIVGSFNLELDYPDSSPQLFGDWFYFKENYTDYRRFNYKKYILETVTLNTE